MTRLKQVALRHRVEGSEVMSQLPLHLCRTAQFGAVLPGMSHECPNRNFFFISSYILP